MWGQCYGAALWGRGTLRAHRDSAMGQEDPLTPWGQRYGAALWGRGSHRHSAMGRGVTAAGHWGHGRGSRGPPPPPPHQGRGAAPPPPPRPLSAIAALPALLRRPDRPRPIRETPALLPAPSRFPPVRSERRMAADSAR